MQSIKPRKDSPFNKCCWNNYKSTYQKKKKVSTHVPFEKVNSKWIIDLNPKCKTKKNSEDNIGKSLDYLRFGNDVLIKLQKHNP